ncbi:MAG: hypothetical protein OXM55_05650 [Bdellovibrionales bacterium]|nr:hypothetical protein [Bdellovibrionales bacterium]
MNESYLQLLSYCMDMPYTGENNQVILEMITAIDNHIISDTNFLENKNYERLFQIATPFAILRSKYSLHKTKSPIDSDLKLLISTLSWIKKRSSSNLKSFIISSVILSCLSDHSLEFNEIVSDVFVNKDKSILDRILNIIEKFKLTMGVPDNAPLYEKDNVQRYLDAKKKGVYSSMANYLQKAEKGSGLPRPSILKYAILYVIKNDFKRFLIVLDKRNSLLEINILLNSLSLAQLVQIAKMTKSKLVYFELTRLIFSNDRSTKLSDKEKSDLAESICIFLKENEECKSEFLNFFFKYPPRYSSLMEVTGQAVTKYGKGLLCDIVKIFPMNLLCKDQLDLLLKGMLDGLDSSARHDFLRVIFKEWLSFYNSKSLNPNGLSLSITSMADGVCRYFSHISSEAYFKFLCERIDCLSSIEETWYSIKIDFLIIIEKELSQFAVAAFAYDNKKFIPPAKKIQNKIKYLFTDFSYKYQFDLTKNQKQMLNQIRPFFHWVNSHP